MNSYSISESITFTITHARHLASKVATDLVRMHRYYGAPSLGHINAYEEELTMLLRDGYLGEVTYGFRRNGNWIEPTLRYSAKELTGSATDDDPGRVPADADVRGAEFHSYLSYSAAWDLLSDPARENYNARRPFQRTGAPEPGVSGYLHVDRNYAAGGRALQRFTVRSKP